MNDIPNATTVAERLKRLNYPQLEELSRLSAVPFHTLLKIRSRETENPGIETVGKFWSHIEAAAAKAAA